MTNDIAIRVENLGKRYVIGREPPRAATVAGRIRQSVASPFSWLTSQMRGPSEEEILWALRDVSFEVKRGEVLGIIGRNGAGKSTLLKILSRITEPTTGHAEIHGRIAALLEVGTGMHPELTGRENIYLNGTILGMRKFEIDSKFDEIVDFSGIERFLDTQVKRYSSGMRVRLGFAIAAHLEPEILVIDEVLAVGDVEFQRKCLGKMKDVAGHGRTVLFVSHNLIAVSSLCSQGLLLDHGAGVLLGKTPTVIAKYKESIKDPSNKPKTIVRTVTLPDGTLLTVNRVWLRQLGVDCESACVSKPFELHVSFSSAAGMKCWLGLHFYNEDNVLLFATNNRFPDSYVGVEPGPLGPDARNELAMPRTWTAVCEVPAQLLNPGFHRLILYVNDWAGRNLLALEDALRFDVEDDSELRNSYVGKTIGAVRPQLLWQTAPL